MNNTWEYWCPRCKNERFESVDLGLNIQCDKCEYSDMALMSFPTENLDLVECPTCHGIGANLYDNTDCSDCAGRGFQPTVKE